MNNLFVLSLALIIVFCLTSCSKKKTDLGDHYFKQGKNIVYQYQFAGPGSPKLPWDNKFSPVHANVQSFTVLPFQGYAKDNKRFFYKGKPIDHVDYTTFEISDYQMVNKDNNRFSGIAKDKKNVYKYTDPWNVIEQADPKTYRFANIIPDQYLWFKDDYNYFVKDTLVKVDYDTFKNIQGTDKFYVDKDNIYLLDTNPGKKLLLAIPSKGIDLQEVVYTNNLIQTKDALYVKGKPDSFIKIPIKDFSTLKYFGDSNTYLMVDQKVFCKGYLLEDVDCASFTVLQYNNDSGGYMDYAKDKNRVYFQNVVLQEADPAIVRSVQGVVQDDNFKWVPDRSSSFVTVKKIAKAKE